MIATREVHLRDVADFVRGINFKPDDVVPLGAPSSVACMRTKNVQAELDLSDVWGIPETFVKRPDQFLRVGDILVSSANSWNLVGKCCSIPDLPWQASFGGFVSVLRADPSKAEPRFLYRWFASDRIQAILRSFGQKTTNISNLNIDRCRQLPMPLPCLTEQRRIADFLDRAEALRTKRHAALAQLDTLTQSIFIDMFGDPVTNPKQWETQPLGDLARIIRGASPRPKGDPRYFGGRIPWLMISDLTAEPGKLVTRTKETVTEAGRDKSVYLQPGTLVLTNSATVGVPKVLGIAACIHDGFLALLDLDKRIEQDFLFMFFLLMRAHLSRLAPEGTQKNLNTGIAKALRMIVPPLDLQRAFCNRISAVDELRKSNLAASTSSDSLFSSLQHRAFRGEL